MYITKTEEVAPRAKWSLHMVVIECENNFLVKLIIIYFGAFSLIRKLVVMI